PALTRLLATPSREAPPAMVAALAEPPTEPAEARRPPSEIDEEALVSALRANRWSVRPTARQLGISKTSLYELIERSTRIRKAADVSPDELRRAHTACAGDVLAMSDALEVSPSGLRLRLKELGLR
ncbi:MAG: sigma-54-dependent Fis family transcriptional regulator, partial [Deltaproteobacteria bacterium]